MADYTSLDDNAINEAQQQVYAAVSQAQMEQQARVFKILGDVNRVKIMHVLLLHERLCVYEMARLIEASVATTSHHLRTLRQNGMIQSKKEGKHVIYSLAGDLVGQFIGLADQMRVKCPNEEVAKRVGA